MIISHKTTKKIKHMKWGEKWSLLLPYASFTICDLGRDWARGVFFYPRWNSTCQALSLVSFSACQAVRVG
jgi:hypothetical protein